MKQAKHCIQEPHRPTVSLNQSETMLFNTDIGHEKDLVGHEATPCQYQRGTGCFGGRDCLKFPSIQIRGWLGQVCLLLVTPCGVRHNHCSSL